MCNRTVFKFNAIKAEKGPQSLIGSLGKQFQNVDNFSGCIVEVFYVLPERLQRFFMWLSRRIITSMSHIS